jgi:hypothetical protein
MILVLRQRCAVLHQLAVYVRHQQWHDVFLSVARQSLQQCLCGDSRVEQVFERVMDLPDEFLRVVTVHNLLGRTEGNGGEYYLCMSMYVCVCRGVK